MLDFSKPALLDPNPVLSEATPNDSNVSINADDMSFFRAVQRVIDTKVTSKRTWYGSLHKNFTYDFGLWLFALPLALFLATYYMDQILHSESTFASYRWAFFIYATGMVLIGYRFLTSYAKWAFPVNVLVDNKDTAWGHRLAIGSAGAWLFYKLAGIVEVMILG